MNCCLQINNYKMAAVQNFEATYHKFNVDRICTEVLSYSQEEEGERDDDDDL
jgi:hypothetical protein